MQFPDARVGFLGWINPPPVELKSNIFKNGKLKAKRQTKVKKSPTVFRISENKKRLYSVVSGASSVKICLLKL